MKRVAIFVEGQTEQIFVGKLIYQIYGYQGIKVVNEEINGKSMFIRLADDSDADAFHLLFQVVDVGTDERVLSAMLENAPHMADAGYNKIVGLRDLYPEVREDKASVIAIIQELIDETEQAEMLRMVLAIMEVEAWFLADPGLFERVTPQLTADHIKTTLKYDLEEDDPELAYKHPANVIKDIYHLAGLLYRKKADDTYKITENIDYNTLCLDAQEKGKIDSFFRFMDEIENLE